MFHNSLVEIVAQRRWSFGILQTANQQYIHRISSQTLKIGGPAITRIVKSEHLHWYNSHPQDDITYILSSSSSYDLCGRSTQTTTSARWQLPFWRLPILLPVLLPIPSWLRCSWLVSKIVVGIPTPNFGIFIGLFRENWRTGVGLEPAKDASSIADCSLNKIENIFVQIF